MTHTKGYDEFFFKIIYLFCEKYLFLLMMHDIIRCNISEELLKQFSYQFLILGIF